MIILFFSVLFPITLIYNISPSERYKGLFDKLFKS